MDNAITLVLDTANARLLTPTTDGQVNVRHLDSKGRWAAGCTLSAHDALNLIAKLRRAGWK